MSPQELHISFAAGVLSATRDPVQQIMFNPPVSERQRRFFGAELARMRAGKRPRTNVSKRVAREFARG